jgi:hypothetical protein
VVIGSLSRGKARQKFSRIKAESEYGAAEFLTKPVDVDQSKIQLREVTQRIKSDSNVRKPPDEAIRGPARSSMVFDPSERLKPTQLRHWPHAVGASAT